MSACQEVEGLRFSKESCERRTKSWEGVETVAPKLGFELIELTEGPLAFLIATSSRFVGIPEVRLSCRFQRT